MCNAVYKGENSIMTAIMYKLDIVLKDTYETFNCFLNDEYILCKKRSRLDNRHRLYTNRPSYIDLVLALTYVGIYM